MITDEQIIETLKARNYDIEAVGKLLKVHHKKVEKVYNKFKKKDSAKVAKELTQKAVKAHKEKKIAPIPDTPQTEDKLEDPESIEKNFVDKAYSVKMAALKRMETLVATEIDPAKLAAVIRSLDSITSKQEPTKTEENNREFFKLKYNEKTNTVKRVG